jgi:glyoxylase-like metal-dependent hydrolase (beta-lactamase superfamily II)
MSRPRLALSLALLLSALATTASATTPIPPLAVRQVRGGIHEVTGGTVNNTGFFVGEHEVVVIDAKMTEAATREVVAQIKKLTPKPITFVALTHSDRDHVGGLAGYPFSARIISHENARRDLEQAKEFPRAQRPQLTFTGEMDLHLAGARVRLLHFGPAHTDGDVVVYFPAAKVAFVGDILNSGSAPAIHRHKRGSATGLVKVLKAVLRLDADTFVRGHGPAASRTDIEARIREIEATQGKVKALVAQKRSLAAVKQALRVVDAPVPKGGHRWPSLVETVYRELTEKQ